MLRTNINVAYWWCWPNIACTMNWLNSNETVQIPTFRGCHLSNCCLVTSTIKQWSQVFGRKSFCLLNQKAKMNKKVNYSWIASQPITRDSFLIMVLTQTSKNINEQKLIRNCHKIFLHLRDAISSLRLETLTVTSFHYSILSVIITTSFPYYHYFSLIIMINTILSSS